jgi:phage-related protein
LKLFEIFGEIKIDDKKGINSIDKMDKKADGLASKLGKGLKTAGKVGAVGIGAITAGAGALGGMASKAAEMTDNIDKMSQKLGMSRQGFQEWDFILSQSGASIDSMKMGMKTLADRAVEAAEGTGEGSKAFDKLGLSATDAAGKMKSQEQIFNETVTALQQVENDTERAALANDLLGRSGQELAPLLNAGAGSIENMKNKARDLGLVINNESIDAGVKFTDTVDQLKRSFGAAAAQVGADLLPMFQRLAEWVISNMPTIQEVFSKVFGVISTVVSTAYDIFNDYLLPIFKEIYNWGVKNWPVFQEIMDVVFKAIKEVVTTLWEFFEQNLLPIFKTIYEWAMENMPLFKTIFKTAFDIIIGVVKLLWEWFSEYLLPEFQKIFDWLKENWPTFQNVFETVFNAISDVVKTVYNWFKDNLLPIFETAYNWVKENFPGFGDFVVGAFDSISGAISDTVGWFKDVIEWAEKAINKVKEFLGWDKKTREQEQSHGYTNHSPGTYTREPEFSDEQINQMARQEGVDLGVAEGMLKGGKTIDNSITINAKTTVDTDEMENIVRTTNDRRAFELGL